MFPCSVASNETGDKPGRQRRLDRTLDHGVCRANNEALEAPRHRHLEVSSVEVGGIEDDRDFGLQSLKQEGTADRTLREEAPDALPASTGCTMSEPRAPRVVDN
jgi:hypothetical protein